MPSCVTGRHDLELHTGGGHEITGRSTVTGYADGQLDVVGAMHAGVGKARAHRRDGKGGHNTV